MSDQALELQEARATDVLRFDALLRAWSGLGLHAARTSADPAPAYVELHGKPPVVRADDNTMILLKMEDVLFVNKHHGVKQAAQFLGSDRPAIPLGLDGPEHTRYLRLLAPVFAPRRISSLAPQVRQLAHALIDSFAGKGEADAYAAWCDPLPGKMFLSMMGLPPAHFDEFLHFKDLVLASSSEAVAKVPVEERERMRQEAVTWIQDYFAGEIRRRQTSGEAGDDMLGWLLTSEVDGEKLPRESLLDILGVLMIAGLDTVGASLACSLSYLARHPEQRSLLVADPSLWPSAIEELLRYESPVTSGGRVATTDLDLPSGEHVPAGTLMALSWHAANVDPGFFPDPLTVDFARSPNRHLAFASGFHRCLGSHLARMELTVALEAWHSRIPDYQIKPGTSLTYSEIVRTPRHLPLIWSVA